MASKEISGTAVDLPKNIEEKMDSPQGEEGEAEEGEPLLAEEDHLLDVIEGVLTEKVFPSEVSSDSSLPLEELDNANQNNANVENDVSPNKNNVNQNNAENNATISVLGVSDGDDDNNNAERSISARPGSSAPSPSIPAAQAGNDRRIQAIEQKTDMITGKMKNNLDELMRRDVALDDLEETAGGLAEGAKQFHQTSKKVSRKMWCRNHKWSFVIACAVIVVLVGIALGIAGSMGAFNGKK